MDSSKPEILRTLKFGQYFNRGYLQVELIRVGIQTS